MTPRRSETDGRVVGTYGWRDRGKWTEGSSVFMAFVPGHPSVPFVLALPVSETDGAETDVPETEEGRPRRMSPRRRKGRPRRRKAARDGSRWMSPRRKVCFYKH